MDSVDDGSQSVQSGSDEIVPTNSTAIIVTCVCDQNLQATFYCEHHDDVMCKICKTLKHKTCKVVTVKEKSGGHVKPQMSSLLERVKSLKVQNDKLVREQNTGLETLTQTKEKGRKKIQAFRKELNGLLDCLENESYEQLDKDEKQQLQKFQDSISASEIIDEMLQTDIDLLQGVLETNETESQFAAEVKVSNRLDHCFASFKDAFAKPLTPVLTFEADKELTEILKKMKTFGTIAAESSGLDISGLGTEKEKSRDSLEGISRSFLNTAYRVHSHVDIYGPAKTKEADISGCEIMSKGEVVLCDHANKTVIVLNSLFSFSESLSFTHAPWDVSAASDNVAIITLPLKKRLQFVDVRPRLGIAKEVQLDKKCWAIKVLNGNIYVTCFDTLLFGRRDGEVRVLDLKGNIIRKLGVNRDGSYLFSYPICLSVSASSGKVFVIDNWDNTVTCLGFGGNVVYKYKNVILSGVLGVCIDDQDNAMVCGKESNNVLIITAEGKLHASALTASDRVKSPQCVSFRRSDNILIVGCANSKSLITMVMA